MSDESNVDPNRLKKFGETGFPIRAKFPNGTYGTVDIADLDKPSLVAWLKSRGGDNKMAEHVVCVLLGHEIPHDAEGG